MESITRKEVVLRRLCGWMVLDSVRMAESVGGARVNGPINPPSPTSTSQPGLGSKVIANQAGPVKLTGEWVGPAGYNGWW